MAKATARAQAKHSVRTIRKRLERLLKEPLNVHHRHYPRRAYERDMVAKRFRELPCQKVIMIIDEHNDHHRCVDPPAMPPSAEMIATINRCKNNGCESGRCTKPITLMVTSVAIDSSRLPPSVRLVNP